MMSARGDAATGHGLQNLEIPQAGLRFQALGLALRQNCILVDARSFCGFLGFTYGILHKGSPASGELLNQNSGSIGSRIRLESLFSERVLG